MRDYPLSVDEAQTSLATVVEFHEFSRRAAKLLTAEEREALILQIASERDAWPVIEGSGGLRKARFGFGGRGKSAGARIVYYFHCEGCPTYLIAIFAKNEKTDLSAEELAVLKKWALRLKGDHKEG